ncbi:unnamed protein product [Camellia sinensis]
MPFTITEAHELQISVAVFWTFATCAFMGYYQYRALLDKGLTPLKGRQLDAHHNTKTHTKEEKRQTDLQVCKAMASDNKPHAVCIPYPAQSHIKGMLKLVKLLHHRGFYITFVSTEFNQNRLTKARGPDSLNGFPNFQFKTIPDSLPPSDPNTTQDAIALCGSVRRNFLTPFRNLLAQLNEDNNNATTPTVTCIVSDGVMPFTITAADELRIPVAVFWTFSACAFMGFYQFRALLDKGLAPLKGAHHKHKDTHTKEKRRALEGEVCKAMAMAVAENKPHAVCIPYPAQSHIKGIMKLAKLLHHRGFFITFVNTEFNQNRLTKARGPDSLNGFPNFQFKTIPDSLPPSDPNATHDVAALCGSVRRNFLTPFRNLLAKLNDDDNATPAVTCIVSDGVMPFTIKVADELRIPVAMFWTFAACGFMGFYQYRALLDKGLTPLKDASYLTNGYIDTVIDWIPGMKDIRLKDLPTFLQTADPNNEIFNLCMESAESASQASAIGLHTFDALEQDLLDTLSSMFPHVYTIGPLQLLLNQQVSPELESLGYNLWKEEAECLQWLDSKEPRSVVYVNFGSIVVISLQHLIEFAWGLANSNHHFLWVIRPDLVIGDLAILPPEFEADTKEKGLIAGWCPQEEILNHPSVGAFLTHSGWNSTIESLTAGVPMMCWPFFGDQVTNCKYICNEWEVGMEIDNNVKRDEVEKLVREFMEGENGKKMKNKALEWKNLAEKATGPDGSSTFNLDKLVNVLLSRN